MAKAGRVQHWKHGWIPISPEAKAFAAGKGPRPALRTSAAATHVPTTFQTSRSASFSDAEKAEVQGYLDSYLVDLFPGAVKGHRLQVQKVDRSVLGDGVWADTDMQGVSHKIRLSDALWDDEVVEAAVKGNPGAVIGTEARSPAEFRKLAVQHELGHYINARSRESADGGGGMAGNGPRGPLDFLADEKTTPRKQGYTAVPPGAPDSALDQPVPRWAADSLDHKSEYAVSGIPDEWIAEALLDGVFNGSRASKSGKAALAIATQEFGPADKRVTVASLADKYGWDTP